ncbi:MAG: ZIP family metal transporter [Candidatus Limnocylindria bacterium]
MPEPIQAGLWGALAGSSLVLGAVAALTLRIPRRIVALVMAFGAGALVSALAFDLADEAFRVGGTLVFGLGLAAGAMAYFAGDRLIDRMSGTGTSHEGQTGGAAIVLGALLDGLPESLVLGATLIGSAGISPSFLAAVLVSNLPEGLAGSRDLADEGHSVRWILGLWVGIAAASGLAAAIGNAALGAMGTTPLAVAQSFAAGAIITMLADTMFPEAYETGGDRVGLATALGFATAFLLSRA